MAMKGCSEDSAAFSAGKNSLAALECGEMNGDLLTFAISQLFGDLDPPPSSTTLLPANSAFKFNLGFLRLK